MLLSLLKFWDRPEVRESPSQGIREPGKDSIIAPRLAGGQCGGLGSRGHRYIGFRSAQSRTLHSSS